MKHYPKTKKEIVSNFFPNYFLLSGNISTRFYRDYKSEMLEAGFTKKNITLDQWDIFKAAIKKRHPTLKMELAE